MLKKLFTNDKFFLTCVVLDVINGIAFNILQFVLSTVSFETIASSTIQLICVVVLYISYNKHNKNVMKTMLGAVLMSVLLNAIGWTQYSSSIFNNICSAIYLISAIVVFVNHFIINSVHSSSPKHIKVNQIAWAIIALDIIIWEIPTFVSYISILNIASGIVNIIGFPCSVAAIVCVESRLDAYRLDRETAGWTEDVGYPKGYVR